MAANVPMIPSLDNQALIRIGYKPSAQTWASLASIVNWSNGVGCTLVPPYSPMNSIATGTTVTYNFAVFGTYPNWVRMWIVRGRCASAGVSTVTVTADAGQTATGIWSENGTVNPPIVVFETLASRPVGTTPDYEPTTLQIGSDGATIVIDEIGCHEVPRIDLLETDVAPPERGVNNYSLVSGRDIYAQTATNVPSQSIHAVALAVRHMARQNNPRIHPNRTLFAWAVPEADELTSTDVGGELITELPVPFLPQRNLAAIYTPSSSIRFLFRAKVTGAGNALCEFRVGEVEDVSGALWQSVSFSSTSYSWQSDAFSMSRAEETDTADSEDARVLDGGTPKWSEFELRMRLNTATSVELSSIAVIDEGT